MAKKVKPIFWICGNYYDTRKQWNKIVGLFKNPNIEVIECGANSESTPPELRAATVSEVIRLLKSKDMFDDRPRIIRVRGLPEDYALLAEYVNLVNDDNVLVIDSPIGYTKGKRFISAATSNLYKVIKNTGAAFEFPEAASSDEQAIKWMSEIFQEKKKTIEPEASSMMVQILGRNFDSLYSYIVKICDYQSGKKITTDDIEKCCPVLFQKTVWDLVNSLDDYNVDSALTHLQKFYDNTSDTDFRSEVEMLLGALQHHYLFLLIVKDGCGETMSYEGMVNSIGGFKKRNASDELVDSFNKGSVMMSIKNSHFSNAFKSAKHKIYMSFLNTCRCRDKIRRIQQLGIIRSMLDALCLSICGKLNEEHFLSILGYDKHRIQQKLMKA